MVVPGLNAPGLVPAKKLNNPGRSVKNEAWSSIRDSSNFWSPKGVRYPPSALPRDSTRRPIAAGQAVANLVLVHCTFSC